MISSWQLDFAWDSGYGLRALAGWGLNSVNTTDSAIELKARRTATANPMIQKLQH